MEYEWCFQKGNVYEGIVFCWYLIKMFYVMLYLFVIFFINQEFFGVILDRYFSYRNEMELFYYVYICMYEYLSILLILREQLENN